MADTLLLADDEAGITALMRQYFEAAGYRVVCASSGREALERLSCRPDLILLDISMPDVDGLEVCRRIRSHVSCPILFLTARIETADKVLGFQAGGDDYIVKPFDLDELGARVAAHLRRERRGPRRPALRCFGALTIDYESRTAEVGGTTVPLSKKEFDIVALLSLHDGQVFDRERIYERVWGLEGDGSSDTVMEHIRKIRAKLGRCTKHDYIHTVWGVGYKWNG